MAFAAGEKKTGQVPSALPVAAKVQQITGEVRAVNYSAMSITVAKKCKDKVLETVVAVDNRTRISKDGRKGTFDDIKTGDKVVVKYTEVKGRNIAQDISIKLSKPGSKEKETETKRKPVKK
jgi:Cu/Ag efflux protein CusF